MQAAEEDVLDRVFFALSDPVRRAILDRLGETALLVSGIAAPFEISLQAVSRHIQVLVSAGLIRQERTGRLSTESRRKLRTHRRRMKCPQPPVVSMAQWLDCRRHLLTREKEFTRLRDQLGRERRALPRVRIDKAYAFDTEEGGSTLFELFGVRSQLVVDHFMFGPDWKEGSPSCSFWADNFNGIDVHLRHRDIELLAVSRAPLEKLQAYRARMGWQFRWVSSLGSDFNHDFHVSFTSEEINSGVVTYNYTQRPFPVTEAPGISLFARDAAGDVILTYACFARGLDMLNGACHYMDLTPKGRDEEDLPHSMAWLRRQDRYETG